MSNSLYPLASLPAWMRFGVYCNPTTYVVTGLRELALSQASAGGSAPVPLWICFTVCTIFAVLGLLAALRGFAGRRG